MITLVYDTNGLKKKIRAHQAGDWWYWGSTIHTVSDDKLDEDSAFLVAIHELVEAYQCRKKGIKDDVIATFDEMYEAERREGKHEDFEEPGDDPRSPYRTQHQEATFAERAVCAAIGLDWEKHEKNINLL
jgi:hypothetical protein